MQDLVSSLRIAFVTMLICVVGYTLAIFGVSRSVPGTAEGSLLTSSNGTVVGSRLIAQGFTEPGYFWPRPSAVEYNAAAAGGSNKSPTSTDLTVRARDLIVRYGASAEHPLPAELVAASGSGLDPDVSVRAALYQAERVARARGLPRDRIAALVERMAFAPGAVPISDRLVNVLELNIALDELH